MNKKVDWLPIATIVAAAMIFSWTLISEFQEKKHLRERVDELEIEVARQKDRAANLEIMIHELLPQLK